jgi:hypothetical protein
VIAAGETDPTAAEVPFFLPLTADTFTGPGLTGHTFVLGEVQIKLPGAGWVNADLSAIKEKGYGRYVVQLDSAQTTTPGVVYIRANVSGAQPYSGVEEIGTAGGDIIENDATARIPFYLASRTNPVNTPITGWGFSAGEVRVCLPGGTYADAVVANIAEVGFGAYELILTTAQTAHRGKIFIYVLTATAQRYEAAATILSPAVGIGGTVGGGTGTIPSTAVTSPLSTNAAGYVDHVAAALNRLPMQYRSS